MSRTAKNRVKSSWTPLSNEEANQKWKELPTAQIFDERRNLVVKWFDKWTDSQRKQVLSDLMEKCKLKQIEFASNLCSQRKPVYHEDFTRTLPRVISLYILSFLDPRSLCRSSQVCWYWKLLCDSDHLWMLKALRLGWSLPFSPSPYESGLWKKLYIENIMALKCLTPTVPRDLQIESEDTKVMTSRSERPGSARRTPRAREPGRPPWKGSDPIPKDTWRNNYLENDDEIEKFIKLRKKGAYGREVTDLSRRATNKVDTKNIVLKRPSSLPRSKSTPGFEETFNANRPNWAMANTETNGVTSGRPGPVTPTRGTPQGAPGHHGSDPPPVNASMDRTGVVLDAGKRPAPIKTIKVTNLKTHRTPRDPPSSNLFPEQPWTVPDETEYDSDVY